MNSLPCMGGNFYAIYTFFLQIDYVFGAVFCLNMKVDQGKPWYYNMEV